MPTPMFRIFFIGMLAVARAKQSEGERCDTNNGSLRGDTGLICRSASGGQLSITGRGVALCCPPDDVAPSVDACRAGAAQLPPETPPVTTPADAGTDSGS